MQLATDWPGRNASRSMRRATRSWESSSSFLKHNCNKQSWSEMDTLFHSRANRQWTVCGGLYLATTWQQLEEGFLMMCCCRQCRCDKLLSNVLPYRPKLTFFGVPFPAWASKEVSTLPILHCDASEYHHQQKQTTWIMKNQIREWKESVFLNLSQTHCMCKIETNYRDMKSCNHLNTAT